MAKLYRGHWINTVHQKEIQSKAILFAATVLSLGSAWWMFQKQSPFIYLVILFLILVWVGYLRKPTGVLRAGYQGEEAVLRVLSGLPKHYTVFSDREIYAGKRKAQIDLIVLAPHGIWVVEVKNYAGVLSGQPYEKNLVQKKRSSKDSMIEKTVYNPILQVKIHRTVLLEHLKSQGYVVPVHYAVVFVGKHFSLQVPWKNENVFTDAEKLVQVLLEEEEKNKHKEKLPKKELTNLLRKRK